MQVLKHRDGTYPHYLWETPNRFPCKEYVDCLIVLAVVNTPLGLSSVIIFSNRYWIFWYVSYVITPGIPPTFESYDPFLYCTGVLYKSSDQQLVTSCVFGESITFLTFHHSSDSLSWFVHLYEHLNTEFVELFK